MQSKVLDELHGGHLETVKMKVLGRAHVWWPSIDKDIEQTTQRCSGCQRMKHDPKLTPTHPWEYPDGPPGEECTSTLQVQWKARCF